MRSKNNKKSQKVSGNKARRPEFSKKERLQESLDMSKGRVTPDQRKLSREYENDPTWYAHNSQLLKDYASYPFGIPLGNSLYNQNSVYLSNIPGLMTFGFYPSVGVAIGETSPINVAMRKLYSFVRHANSGAKNYDAPDLMMYVVAVDSARMYLEFLKRAYGVMLNYTAFNRYYPRALVESMGISFTDIENRLNDFRGFINQYAVKLNQLWVPAGFSYFARHEWLCQHYYVDSADSNKPQTYMFVPKGFYKFEVSGDPAVGQLTMVPFGFNNTLETIIIFGNALLNSLITNEDIGIMSGDILKAYGESGVLKTYGIDEMFTCLPEYSEEVMSQIENIMTATVYPESSLNVTQDTTIGGGYLKSQPKGMVTPSKVGSPGVPPTAGEQNYADAIVKPLIGSRLLNLHNNDTSPEHVIVATRGMFTVDQNSVKYFANAGNPSATFNFKDCGSEIFEGFYVYNSTGGKSYYDYRSSNYFLAPGVVGVDLSNALNRSYDAYARISQFDWHPNVYIGMVVTNSPDFIWSSPHYPFLDVDNYTFVDESNVGNMHMVALLSEFTVPMVG